jgi:Cof subfamily protein (haloacid dehalogenase superfamily)
MYKYKGYLIVSDLDGTLINSKQEISKLNSNAIASFVEEGGLFAVATGRTELNVQPYIMHLKINCPSILYNGAVIYDTNKDSFIKSIYLDKSLLIEPLKEILKKYKNLCMQIFTPGKMFIVSGEYSIDPIVLKEEQAYEIASIDDMKDENWIKLLFADTGEALRDVQQFLINELPSRLIHSVFSSPTYLEIFAKGVTKGSALESLIGIAGISREKAIAIGDYCNDIEMLQTAGLGVATANAHPLLKEVAHITTVSNNEHAIYDLIYRILPLYKDILDQDKKDTKTPVFKKLIT